VGVRPTTLVICCGAITREVVRIVRDNGWEHIRVKALPARLHNQPKLLPDAVREQIRANRDGHDRILVLYSDCGTGGLMERVIEEEGAVGIGGAHCYEVFAGAGPFREIIDDEPGCFFVTDFLARNFEHLVFQGLGLDRYPQLRDTYFGRYRKLVYLAQTRDAELEARARAAAESIGLEFEIRHTGYGGFEPFLSPR